MVGSMPVHRCKRKAASTLPLVLPAAAEYAICFRSRFQGMMEIATRQKTGLTSQRSNPICRPRDFCRDAYGLVNGQAGFPGSPTADCQYSTEYIRSVQVPPGRERYIPHQAIYRHNNDFSFSLSYLFLFFLSLSGRFSLQTGFLSSTSSLALTNPHSYGLF
jgi:hypothetical protein